MGPRRLVLPAHALAQFIARHKTKSTQTVHHHLRVSAGAADISAFYSMKYEENQPLSSALLSNALAVDQAQDAMRLSNIAILALPLAFSFIPMALIADVNDFAAFIYVILTDFFAAVPFVVKGIELLRTGTITQYVAETWITGKPNLLVSEAWVASCKPRPEFARTGAIFILIGITTIVSGIALEYLARKYMRKRIQQGENPRPLGDAFSAPISPSSHAITPTTAAAPTSSLKCPPRRQPDRRRSLPSTAASCAAARSVRNKTRSTRILLARGQGLTRVGLRSWRGRCVQQMSVGTRKSETSNGGALSWHIPKLG